MGMMLYSCLLTAALLVSSPWWIWRMIASGRYRAGLRGRLGHVPPHLARGVAGRDTIWLHAVSVGEVLAAERLIEELQAALPAYVVAVSTTTATGYALAQQRLPDCPVFYIPLDFAYTMLRYLNTIRPKLVVLMESELWPRMLTECGRSSIPIAVVNARVSDRSYPRYLRLRRLWKPLLAKVALFLAQGDESAERLERIGVPVTRIRVVGNLKYDAPPPTDEEIVRLLRRNLPVGGDTIVCGSTLEGEEAEILEAWGRLVSTGHRGVLIVAPRHPNRFASVLRLAGKFARQPAIRASEWLEAPRHLESGETIVLDTLGHLAAVYKVATVAFLGGSLVPKGGHNPLEAARFGVPVVIGPSYENFREIVDAMRARDAIYLVEHGNLTLALHTAMARGRAVGRRGQEFFETQTGATARTVLALTELLAPGPSPAAVSAPAPLRKVPVP